MSKGLEALERLKTFPIYQEIKRMPLQFRDKKSISIDLDIIDQELKALDIVKKFIWVENGKIHLGLYGDFEIVLIEDDFETKEDYDLLKEVLS